MATKRDRVDYTNLAANVVQTAQLDGINSKMRQMAELELQKEYREQQEVAVAKCEDLLRDAVFFYSEQLRDLEEIASQNPVVAYIRGSHLKRTYEDMPQFKSSGFRKFEDKERLANVQRAYDRFIRESSSRLKPEELQKCNQCIEHIFDRDELLTVISAAEKAEQLEHDQAGLPEKQAAKQAELQKIKEEKQKTTEPVWVTLSYIVVAACAITAMLGFAILFAGSDGSEELCNRGLMLFIPSVVLLLVMVVVLSKNSYYAKTSELARKAAVLELAIASMTHSVSKKEAEIKKHRSLFAKFGTAKADDYRRMLRERDTLLTQMVGDFAKGFIERGEATAAPSASVATAFEVVLVGALADKSRSIAKVIRDVRPDLEGFGIIKLLKSRPGRVCQCASKDEAEYIGELLKNAGAQIEIVELS